MGVFFAWAVGEGIIFWRWGRAGAPPTPGVLLMSSGLFAAAAVIGSYAPARNLATVAALGVDLAVLLQVIGKPPQQVTGWPPLPITGSGILPSHSSGSSGPSSSSASSSTTGPGTKYQELPPQQA